MEKPMIIYWVIAIGILLRLGMLVVSIRHERALKADGAVEVGGRNTTHLFLAHLAFYMAAIVERCSFMRRPASSIETHLYWLGVSLYVFGMLMLFVVALMLGRFWSTKLLIAPDHELVMNPLFRWVRHPNYFLNVLPELAGLALMLHAWATLLIGLTLYAVPLTIRIRQEEAAMAAKFPFYTR